MRRIFWVALTLVGAIGCAPDTNQGFYVVGNTHLSASCAAGTELIPIGTVDVLMASEYEMAALVVNNLDSSLALRGRSLDDGRLEANTIQVQSAKVEYTYPKDPLFQDLSATVGPSHVQFVALFLGPQQLGTAVVNLMKPALDGKLALADAVADRLPTRDDQNPAPSITILTKVTMIGKMSDGTEIRSQPFSFPLRICKGCLLFFPLAAKLGEGPLNCRNEEDAPSVRPCRVGQNDPVDCRICRESKPISLRNECEPF